MQRTQGFTALTRSDVRHYLAVRKTVGEPCAADWQPVMCLRYMKVQHLLFTFLFFPLAGCGEAEGTRSTLATDATVEKAATPPAQVQQAQTSESALPYVRKGEIVYPPAFLSALDSVGQDLELPDSARAYGPSYPYRDSTHLLVTGDFNGDGTQDAAVQDVEGELVVVAHGGANEIAGVHVLEARGLFPGLGVVRRRSLPVSGLYDPRSGAEIRAAYAGLKLNGRAVTGVGGEADTLWSVRVPSGMALLYGGVEGGGTPHFVWDGKRYRLMVLPHA